MKNLKRFQNLILILLSVFILTSYSGCGTITPEPPSPIEEDYIKLDVPYVEQATPKWCLPASGTMVFSYYGVNVTQQQVADKVINEDTGLGSTKKLRDYAKELGFEAEFRNLTLEEVLEVLRQGVPIIVAQDFSLIEPLKHSRVIIGYDDKEQELITNDPSSYLGKNYRISYSEAIALNTIEPPFFRSNMIYPKDMDLDLP
jgi:ABC-type bacteriocin/lantibiotic exporter with double-glycine peptidase domain